MHNFAQETNLEEIRDYQIICVIKMDYSHIVYWILHRAVVLMPKYKKTKSSLALKVTPILQTTVKKGEKIVFIYCSLGINRKQPSIIVKTLLFSPFMQRRCLRSNILCMVTQLIFESHEYSSCTNVCLYTKMIVSWTPLKFLEWWFIMHFGLRI